MKLYSHKIDYYCRIHQNIDGKPYLFILHGFLGSGSVFDSLLDSLKTVCNPVTIDLIGHGKSDGTTDPERYQTKSQIADLSSILNRLNLSPLILYGYSMGGRLALNLAIEHPNFFSGIILESTSCGIQSTAERRERVKLDDQRANAIETDFQDFLEQWAALPLFSCKSGSGEDHNRYITIMKKQNPYFMAASLRGFGSGRMLPVCNRLNSIIQPVLLVAGRNDTKFVKNHTQMEQILEDVASVVIGDSCHRVHLDQPKKLFIEIKNYINRRIK